MTLIYTNQRSKLSKKQRAVREALLKEQRAIKKSIDAHHSGQLVADGAHTQRSRDHREKYPSVDTGCGGVCAKRESQKYTGDLIVGIATMHKSNAVPVMRGTTQAEDIARMRR